jgi:4-aminobutyrate aminotransferase
VISEKELAKLSYEGAPKIVTEIPGPKSKELGAEVRKFEPPAQRPAAREASGAVAAPGAPAAPAASPAGALETGQPFWDEGRGATLKDVDGNVFIDLVAGVAVSSTGRVHPKVLEAVRTQSAKLMHGGNQSPIAVELAKKLANIMPGGLRNHCFLSYTQGGSDAVETAIKYARFATGKSQIIAFHRAYHGVWAGSLAMTAMMAENKARFGPLMPGVIHMPYAYCYRCFAGLKYPDCAMACAKYFDYKLNMPATGADDVAAVFVEPFLGVGGYIHPAPEFLGMLKAACDKKGILFVADEVQSGAGRTGKMWAIEHYGITPDMLIFGKGIGCDAPMAGVAVREDLGDKLAGATGPNTFGRNAVSCAIAATNIDLLADKKMDLVGRVAQVGAEVKDRLIKETRDISIVGEVRGMGFAIGIELVRNRETREALPRSNTTSITNKARDRGILIRPGQLMPPLVITREYLNKAIDVVLDVLREEAKSVK